MPCVSVFHRFVFRRTETLVAGTIHHYRCTNLRPVFLFQSAAPDTVMHLVDANNDVIAENDDFTGLASEIIFTPTASGPVTLIIRGFSTKTPGFCNLEKGLGGGVPQLLDRDVLFFGVTVDASWNQGDVFETSNSTGDPFFFLRTANKMFRDDDSGPGLNSRFVAPTAGSGRVILGSFSRTTEGVCDLCLTPAQGPIQLTPRLSERPNEFERKPTYGSPEMERFTSELMENKEALEELEPAEREQRVVELQAKILSEEERLPKVLPGPQAAADFVRCQQIFMERYKEMEPELEELSYEERSERLADLKRRTVGPE
ncbi:MAG: hypothetical protein LC776_00680 [Acidobacteria bacterium]|nr:hypothetical protein [Acidobacteriota bacterium]